MLDIVDYISIPLFFALVASGVLAGFGAYARKIGAVQKRT
jgi:hypothetical protein